MKLSLVVPCYNEEGNVQAFVNSAREELNPARTGYEYEIIFINDGSRDDTLARLKELMQEGSGAVTVIDFTRNFGKEAAIYAGLQRAAGDLIAFVDADLPQPLAVVREMADYLIAHEEYDAAAAYQETRREGRGLSLLKKLFYKVIDGVSDIPFQANASDFRVLRRPVAQALLAMPEYHRFSKGLFSWVGFNTWYRPYQVAERNAGVTSWSTGKLFRYALDGIISFSTKPLKLATGCGLFISFSAVAYMFVVIIQKLFFGIDLPGYPTLVVLILLIGGIQLVVLGIMGEYLARIHIEVKHRPIYLERACYSSANQDMKTEEDDGGKGKKGCYGG